MHEADEVGIDISRGVFDRVTHPGLCGKMHHRVEFAGCEKLAHRLALDDVELLKKEPGTRAQALEPRLLEPDVVVGVQIVDAHNLVAAIEQLVHQRRTDESGSSRDKNLHFLSVWFGGEGGIRTHDTLARIPVFETGTFNRSVTSPVARILPAQRISAPERSPSTDPCKAAARKEYLCRRRLADSSP